MILKNGMCLQITHIQSNNMLQNTVIGIIVIQGHSKFTFMPNKAIWQYMAEVHHAGDFCRHIFSESQYPKLLNAAC